MDETTIIPSVKTTIETTEPIAFDAQDLKTCLFVCQEHEKREEMKQLRKKFKPRWDGLGYLININHKNEVEAFCDTHNLECVTEIEPENFDKLPYYDPIILLEELLATKTKKINALFYGTNIKYKDIEELYSENIKNKIEDLPNSDKALTLLSEYATIKNKIKWQESQRSASSVNLSKEPDNQTITKQILTTDKLIEDQEQRLAHYRGKEFIGLCQKTLPTLDSMLLGLRKFILLTAAPNVGKTALTIQIGIDTVKNNPDTCLLFVSLEMSREDIIDRMRCYLTPMTYKMLYFGSIKDNDDRGWYSKEESNNLSTSKKELAAIGNRILI